MRLSRWATRALNLPFQGKTPSFDASDIAALWLLMSPTRSRFIGLGRDASEDAAGRRSRVGTVNPSNLLVGSDHHHIRSASSA
jgi:hypothetical protein